MDFSNRDLRPTCTCIIYIIHLYETNYIMYIYIREYGSTLYVGMAPKSTYTDIKQNTKRRAVLM